MDVAEYIGKANITTQTAFGLTYLVDFTGTLIIATNDIKKGEIWATVPENLILAYINPNSSAVAREFNLSGDETGFIGMTHFTEKYYNDYPNITSVWHFVIPRTY